jgi:hypothetical protein
MDRAQAAGLTVLRIFVQKSLADDIQAGRWAKLDQVLQLADQHALKLIVTFADYPSGRVADLVAIDTAIATRYQGRPTILAYDLKNEPHFGDLALAVFPPGTYVALQDPALVPTIGEVAPRASIADYRASDDGKGIPARLSDDQAYVYASMLAAFLGYLSDASTWASANGSTTVAYASSPASAVWAPFLAAYNDTLATWIRVHLDAIRAADPQATVTIGHVDAIMASLPANNLLDYRTIHRYPSASSEGIALAVALFKDVQATIPGKALVLGEFGFSNETVPEDRSAELEVQFVRAIRDAGGAGALKWMLNDFPLGFTPRENMFGLFRGDGTAKPAVASYRNLAALTFATQDGLPRPAEYGILDGRFFTQASGRPADRDPSGFSVTNADGIPFWDTWQRLGPETIGYPISRRIAVDGLVTQVFQKAVLRARPGEEVAVVPRGPDPAARALAIPLAASVPEPPPPQPAMPSPIPVTPILAPGLAGVPPTPAPASGLAGALVTPTRAPGLADVPVTPIPAPGRGGAASPIALTPVVRR